MSKELVISSNRHETKVAILEDDQLVEVYFQRANEYSLAGSIHKGRVTRVLPGMQSAFVDLGLERDTFLYVSDFLEEHDDIDRITGDERPSRGDRDRGDRDRGDRDRADRDRADRDRSRDRRQTPPAPQPLATVAEEAASEPATEPIAAETEAVAGPAPAERPEDRGDRRGRRSRRRRNRGRGFPDSKYATPTAAPETAAAEPVEALDEVEEERAPASAEFEQTSPIVLPGE